MCNAQIGRKAKHVRPQFENSYTLCLKVPLKRLKLLS